MLYRALVSFCGLETMAAGDVKELAPAVAEDLLKAGYVEPVNKKPEKPAKKEK